MFKKIIEDFEKELNEKIKLKHKIELYIDYEALEKVSNLEEFRDFMVEYIESSADFEIIYNSDCIDYISENDPSLLETQDYLSDYYGDEVPTELINVYNLANMHLQSKALDILEEVISKYSES